MREINERHRIDEILDSENKEERIRGLEELKVGLVKTHKELDVGGGCEEWAFSTLDLYRFKDKYDKFIQSLDFVKRFHYRCIDFLLLDQQINLIKSFEDNTLIAYWHSYFSKPTCPETGLPHYSHYGVCKGNKNHTFLSKWGLTGHLYQTESALNLPTSYGDRFHIFRVKKLI